MFISYFDSVMGPKRQKLEVSWKKKKEAVLTTKGIGFCIGGTATYERGLLSYT